jgi:nucleotide-binding universal stress UspA family protein
MDQQHATPDGYWECPFTRSDWPSLRTALMTHLRHWVTKTSVGVVAYPIVDPTQCCQPQGGQVSFRSASLETMVTMSKNLSRQHGLRDLNISLLGTQQISYRCRVVAGKPAEAIACAVDQNQADLIIMGSTGTGGLANILFGSVARQVVEQSKVSVTLVR